MGARVRRVICHLARYFMLDAITARLRLNWKRIEFGTVHAMLIAGVMSLPARDLAASTFAAPVNLGTVTAPAIKEASGMVASLDNPGVLWIENDSGNPNAIYAINLRGQLLGTYNLTGAANDDWEDMSVGPGPEPGVNYLYLANSATSSGFQGSLVVRVPEPTVYAAQQVGAPVTQNISGAVAIVFMAGAECRGNVRRSANGRSLFRVETKRHDEVLPGERGTVHDGGCANDDARGGCAAEQRERREHFVRWERDFGAQPGFDGAVISSHRGSNDCASAWLPTHRRIRIK